MKKFLSLYTFESEHLNEKMSIEDIYNTLNGLMDEYIFSPNIINKYQACSRINWLKYVQTQLLTLDNIITFREWLDPKLVIEHYTFASSDDISEFLKAYSYNSNVALNAIIPKYVVQLSDLREHKSILSAASWEYISANYNLPIRFIRLSHRQLNLTAVALQKLKYCKDYENIKTFFSLFNTYINFNRLSRNCELTMFCFNSLEDYIHKLNWDIISARPTVASSVEFLDTYASYLDWSLVSRYAYDLDFNIINKFKIHLDPYLMLMNGNLPKDSIKHIRRVYGIVL